MEASTAFWGVFDGETGPNIFWNELNAPVHHCILLILTVALVAEGPAILDRPYYRILSQSGSTRDSSVNQ
ncbi:hypothetical protein BDW74DRAFT_150080 [Aspergillus multicolor]|uniref:uncharacterized protein n=1 Tax=Aspergillus multicolor TaxID=41759 RepID=UPI003CCCD18A